MDHTHVRQRQKKTYHNRPRGKLDANGWLWFEIEFVSCKSTQEIRLSDTRISN